MYKTAYRYRIYSSEKRKELLTQQMILAKEAYNILLQESKKYYRETRRTFTRNNMNNRLPMLKKEHPEFTLLHSQVLQNISDRLWKAYGNFFRRLKEKKAGKKTKVGFPRAKTFVVSLTYPQSGFTLNNRRLVLSKVGSMPIVQHRDIEGKMKTLTIKQTRAKEWFATVTAEKEPNLFISNSKPEVGLDLGLKDYATLSDGTKLPNQRFGQSESRKRRRLQRWISRKVKGSRNRARARLRFARFEDHTVNKRKDYLHKLSHNLVNSYSLIGYETLAIPNMVKNHHLAGSPQLRSWEGVTDSS